MKKVAVILVTLFLVACSDQEERVTEAVTIDADTIRTLDLYIKLNGMADRNEQIIKEADIEAVQDYLRGLQERERTDTTTEKTSSEADSQ